jgi:nicotinate-nucleotide--dimethylbenzimidazole phosphoribosyltransferase
MTGTDEFGHELDAQGYERVAGPADGARSDPRAAAARPRGPQPVGRQGAPGQPVTDGVPWLAASGSQGYDESAFGAQQQSPVPAMPRPAGPPMPQQMQSASGHDAPTTEFFPLYDAGEPEDYQVPPATAPTAPRPALRLPNQPGPIQQQPHPQPGPAAQQIPGQVGPAGQQAAPGQAGPIAQQIPGQVGSVGQQVPGQPGSVAQQGSGQPGAVGQQVPGQSGSIAQQIPGQMGLGGQQAAGQAGSVAQQVLGQPGSVGQQAASQVGSGGQPAAGQVGSVGQQVPGQPGSAPMPQGAPIPHQMGAVQQPGVPGSQAGPQYPSQQMPQAHQFQQAPQAQLQQDPDGGGYPEQEFDPLSGSASWSAAPPRTGSPIPQARPAQPQRPAVPAQPMPVPAPLPERGVARPGARPVDGASAAGGVAAGRGAVRQQAESDPLASSGPRQGQPSQAVAPDVQGRIQPNIHQDPQIGVTNTQQGNAQVAGPGVQPGQQFGVVNTQQGNGQVGGQAAQPGQQVGAANTQQVGDPTAQQGGAQVGGPGVQPGQRGGVTNAQQVGGPGVQPGQQFAVSNVQLGEQAGVVNPQQDASNVRRGGQQPGVQQGQQTRSSVFDPASSAGSGASGSYQDLQAQAGLQSVQQPQGSESADASGVRETMAPPRRRVPSAQPPAAQPPRQQSSVGDDLSSERLRSVAPTVPAPRRVPEDSAQDLPTLPPRTPPTDSTQAIPPQQPAQFEEGGQDADELVVPWQSVAQPTAEGLGTAQVQPRGTRRRTETSVDDALPEPVSALQPVLLDPEPGEEEIFTPQGTSDGYEPEFLDEGADDPLSGSGAHARPQEQQPEQPVQQVQSQSEPQPQQQPDLPKESVNPAIRRPGAQASQRQATEASAAVQQPQQEQEQEQEQGGQQPQPAQQGQSSAQQQQQPEPVQQGQSSAQQQSEPVQQGQPSIKPQPAQQAQPSAQPSQQPQVQAEAADAPGQAQPEPATPPTTAARRTVAKQSTKAAASSAASPRTSRTRSQIAEPQSKSTSAPVAAAPTPAPADANLLDDENRAPRYGEEALEAVYRVIHERRDIRNDFLSDELPTEVLTRILEAAHTAPSVGFSQPWDFLVLRDEERRRAVHDLAARQRRAYAASLPKARAKAFAALKIEAILDTPVNIVVTCDPTRGGRHTLGRYTQPMMAPFSTCLAVENLWLAARAEGLGVGWVSFFDERELAETLGLPEHLQIVAYLCVGYVKRFPAEPELAGAGWAKRRPLSWAVHEEDYGRRVLPGGAPVSLLDATVDAVRGLDEVAVAAARERQGRMTKPPGSLGMLEHVAEQLAGLSGQCPPPLPEPAALAVFAADHGVHAQGVTPWPQEVTAQMVANFLAGGAVVNAFAKQVGAEVCVVDVGVNANLGNAAGLIPRKVRFGTADMTQGPALSRDEALAAIEAGIETARDLVAAGNHCLLTGDMGIANTTASAALIAAFTGASPAQVTGYGTGIDEQTYAHKVEIVRRALELHRPDPQDPIGVLAAFGGLEHAALAGFILGGAALRTPVILDGVIAGAAALVAQAIAPEVTVACVAGHRSAEPGHALALEALGVNPLIDLELRLGEGSGAVLALPLVAAAVRALREVATFDSAGVADASSAAVSPTERGRDA